jgi:hypothetical protein
MQVRYGKPKQTAVRSVEAVAGWSVGQLVRTAHGGTVRQVLLWKPDGRRKAGRPKLRWLDCIENDLKLMGVGIWRKTAEERLCGYHAEGGSTGCNVRTVCNGHVEGEHCKYTTNYIH